MPDDRRRALVGDIGGTHARFAISDIDRLTIEHFTLYKTRDFSSFEDAVSAYYRAIDERPRMAAFAIAGPITGDTVALTNAPWSFTTAGIREATGIKNVTLLNDFEAIALSLPYLADSDLQRIGGTQINETAPRLVLGPGTGFGVSGLVPVADGWSATSGEGGHVSFGATSAREMAILEHLAWEFGHVSIERVLSGSGIEAIHAALGRLKNGRTATLPAAEIVARADAGGDAHATQTLSCFVSVLARTAGDFALVFGARGGVYLGGGIAPRILTHLTSGAFRKAFENKGRMSSYLAQIPAFVITAKDPGLRGAAVALAQKRPAKAH
ncbi:glucokinase [Breoghania sp. L-A4]|uniref:glucokinase n=1 Tax=Breoghania sp. L-A4 TaxID=2304600 RepID=UPI000E360C79|nr:glucokinase [Breoghania sp. L-A4]AXS41618.1 glucokinase [Breoghania sp. L-A4]